MASSIRSSVLIRFLVLLALSLAGGARADSFEALLQQGAQLRQQGQLHSSIEALERAAALAAGDAQRRRAAGELGTSLLQARRLEAAQIQLRKAHELAPAGERADHALSLGNLALLRKQEGEARQAYEEAQTSAQPFVRFSARLNLARLRPAEQRLDALDAVFAELGRAGLAANELATLSLNLGHQAQGLGPVGTALAHASLEQARRLAIAPSRLQIEALDALAQLYETQARRPESLRLTLGALEQAKRLSVSAVGEPLIALEWRHARLQAALGEPALALAAYQRAVDHIEALRADIPIEDEAGGSSFRQLFEPVYMGLVDGLLKAADTRADGSEAARSAYLERAVAAVELIKQSEMQDYLGDRCTVDEVKGGTATVIPAGTAVVYPLIFAERLELLVLSPAGLARFTERVRGEALRQLATAFAAELRNGSKGFLPRARQLYEHLLRPLDGLLAAQTIDTLVLVPDGALRLVPMAALHDGQRFAIEKYALSTAAGLSMTNTRQPSSMAGGGQVSLLAGAANFGPVVDRLLQSEQGQSLVAMVTPERQEDRSLRAIRSLPAASAEPGSGQRAAQERALRESLALPGVTREIGALGRMLPDATSMLDAGFTVDAFSRATASGAYGIVHIASHGIFGGDAKSSYLLAYDDLLTLGGLQQLLQTEQFKKQPLELLTLSACETADGNERAPLGISGAAIKARAKSVLGTLWPVNDEAAVTLMQGFYTGLVQGGQSKAQALRQAQLALLRQREFAHPFFWAPFSLIGNWL